MSDETLDMWRFGPFVVIWMAAIGACIGSFLNVVVYRMPVGKSIVHPGSQCPRCGHPIRGYDNVPVLSWLFLRGRCRDCRLPISARYPLVEATVGLVFALVAALEILPGGDGLGGLTRPHPTAAGDWAVGAYHLCLLCTLISAALIDFDRNPVPFRLTIPIVLIGLVAPVVCPALKTIAVSGAPLMSGAESSPGALTAGAIGGAAGALLGVLAWPARAASRTERNGRQIRIRLAVLVATFLGWQAIMVVVCASSLLDLLTRTTHRLWGTRRRPPWSAWLAVATLAYILLWRRLDAWYPPLVTEATWRTCTMGCLLTLGMTAFGRIGTRTGRTIEGA